jgi:glycosyltransferase involved in cell wall biosynthesis
MPVWRRRLHADYGEFDEKNFGPSADWEFWLRVGVQGETFFFLPEALGLYLQHPDSYWHRQEESKQEHFDQRILRRYAGLLYQANSSFHQSLAMDIALAHKLLTAHDYGSGICWLLRSLKRGWQAGGAAQELLTALCQKFLGCAPLEWGPLLAQWNGKSDDLLSVMVDLVHNIKGAVGDRLYRLFDFACLDWYAMTGERQWLSLRAFWARLAGYGPLEKVILKSLFAESPRWFWQHLQSVYRFTAPLKEMVTLLGCMRGATTSDLKATSDIRLIFFPDYRSSNSYTELLYRTIVDQGGLVTAASTVADLAALSPLPGRKNVIHIHWIQAILKDCDASQLTKRVDDFLELLTRQQQKGFALYWTVHNRLSHDGYKPAFESVFRRRLAALVDRIYLHHPLAVELLEWLDDQDKICLVEHGRYTTPTYIDDDPQLSRKVTGIDAQGTVLCHLGLIRDYKGLEETLPVLLNSLSSENTMQVVVAGRVVGASLQKWLQKQRHPRLMIKRERLSLEMLERYMHAADYGFLSYRDILTSGSLFHWFSCGRPVIAPAKGTIPAYVVDGWNGFLYSDETDLGNVIERATSLTMSQRKQLGANALSVANTLNWEFF